VERVLIVAKTHMKSGACLGGLTRAQNRGVRLLPPNRPHYPADTQFDVGQVWDLEFHNAAGVEPPHCEDVIVTGAQFVAQIAKTREILLERIHPWQGGPEQLYDGLLRVASGKGYISEHNPIPTMSTGFWIPDRPMILKYSLDHDQIKPYYRFADGAATALNIPFVGFAEPIKQIAAGTLLRVSLARWFDQNGRTENRCYLQLSGWYE